MTVKNCFTRTENRLFLAIGLNRRIMAKYFSLTLVAIELIATIILFTTISNNHNK